jgi:cation transport regulator ChaC
LQLVALGLRLENDTPAWGIAHRVVEEVTDNVASYIVRRAISDAICRGI